MRLFLYVLIALVFFEFTSQAQVDSVAGKNYFFDGSTQFVDTRDTSLYTSFTVECWVKSPFAPSNLQGKGPVHYEKNFQINWDHVQPSARNSLVLNVTNGGWQSASFGPLEGEKWYHLAGTYDGDTLRTYTNGRLVTEKIIQGGAPVKEAFSLKIGKHAKLSGAQEYFKGNVDEVRVWTRALSAREIQTAMYHPLTGTEPGLKHYYQFNSGQIQGDSVRNLAATTWAPVRFGPDHQNSGFPFGKGSTIVWPVQLQNQQFFSFEPGGVVTLVTDSAYKNFPLLFARINQNIAGMGPDSTLYSPQKSPFFILQPLDTGCRYTAPYFRLNQTWLSPELTSVVASPSQIKVLRRDSHAEGPWEFQDTCASIFWATGHFQFKGLTQGQFHLAVPKELVGTRDPIAVFQPLPFFSTGSGTRTLGWSGVSDAGTTALFDLMGKSVQSWSQATQDGFVLNSSVRSGFYLLRSQIKGQTVTGKVWIP
jgi:hypothetical protein